MTAPNSAGWKTSPFFSRPVLLIAAIYFLPTLLPSLFGWLLGVLAVPVAYALTVNGYHQGIIILRNSLLLACVVSLLSGQLELFLLTLTLFPLGYTLYACGRTKKSEVATGGYGVLVVSISWLLFWTAYGVTTGVHPYQHLVDMLDAGFAQAYELYRTNGDISAEMQTDLALVITAIRELVPKILPGILCCTVLLTVWMNQVVLNSLLLRRHPDKAPWPVYTLWRLPEQLVWVLIVATVIFLLTSGELKSIALNLILISGLIFFFQGLAVFIYLLGKWKVPGYLRVLIYVILVIQSYGLILLTMLGVSEIWFNFRALKEKPPKVG
jgi:uncharacterized protein YybS (DUF2232 family)